MGHLDEVKHVMFFIVTEQIEWNQQSIWASDVTSWLKLGQEFNGIFNRHKHGT